MTKETGMLFLLAGLLFLLAGCVGMPSAPVPIDPKIASAIGRACADSGLFKVADGTLTVFVPAAALPVALVNAGVDQVCANPDKFAADASTVVWLIKMLKR